MEPPPHVLGRPSKPKIKYLKDYSGKQGISANGIPRIYSGGRASKRWAEDRFGG
jgi:hypothetical protein